MLDHEMIGNILVIYLPRGVLAFTPAQVEIARRRGTRYPRPTPQEQRLAAQLDDHGFQHAPTAVTANSPEWSDAGATEHAIKLSTPHAVPHVSGNDPLGERQAAPNAITPPQIAGATPIILTAGPLTLTIEGRRGSLTLELGAEHLTHKGDLNIESTAGPPIPVHVVTCHGPRALVQLTLDDCPRALTPGQVHTLESALVQLAAYMVPEPTAQRTAGTWKELTRLLASFQPVDNVQGGRI